MIVCFGSINLDLIFPVRSLPRPGETVLGQALRMEPGGKGANQAVAAARDGARVIFAGAIGRDALAEPATALLRAEGVDLSRVQQVDAPTGAAAICVDAAGANLIAVASGANLHATAAQVEDALLNPATTLLLQAETPLDQIEALILRARAAGARIVLNLAPAAPLATEALRAVDILVVNSEETAWLAAKLGTGANAPSLQGALGVGVVTTRGGEGLQASVGGEILSLRAHDVAVVDTTAAGDCFCGVLATALDGNAPIRAALERAQAAAAISCTRPGSQASLPTRLQTDAMLAGSAPRQPHL